MVQVATNGYFRETPNRVVRGFKMRSRSSRLRSRYLINTLVASRFHSSPGEQMPPAPYRAPHITLLFRHLSRTQPFEWAMRNRNGNNVAALPVERRAKISLPDQLRAQAASIATSSAPIISQRPVYAEIDARPKDGNGYRHHHYDA